MIATAAHFSAFPPDRPAARHVLDAGVRYRIGRGGEADLRVDHASVSRAHAELHADADGWHLRNVGSGNGLRVDGSRVEEILLDKSSWFQVGDVHCSLEMLDTHAAAARRAAAQSRRDIARELSAPLLPTLGVGNLLNQTLNVVLQLAGMERGFVLYAEKGSELQLRAQRSLRSEDIVRASFSDSMASVDRALESGTSIVCCDTEDSPWLGSRPSLRLGGLRALLCVPLPIAELSGAIYADSQRTGVPLCELTLELIEDVVRHASVALAMARRAYDVRPWAHAFDALGANAPRWDDLHHARTPGRAVPTPSA